MTDNKKTNVLIVDDEPMIRDQLRFAIARAFGDFMIIREADSGTAALDITNILRLDCIITDLKMPDIEPRDFLRKIKASPHNFDTPIIVLTGWPEENLLQEFNPLVLLSKPISMNDFIRFLEGQIRLGRISERLASPLMGPIVASVTDFLTNGLQIQSDPSATTVKHAGMPVVGDLLAMFTISWGSYKARIAIAFDIKFLEKFRRNDKHMNDEDNAQAAERIAQIVFERVCDFLMSHDGCRPLLNSMKFYTADIKKQASLLSSRGLSVPIETELGKIQVYLLTNLLDQTKVA